MTQKKIGILTTYFAANYGAMLQVYALKKTLEALGNSVEVIRYNQKVIRDHYNPFHITKFFAPWWKFHPNYTMVKFIPLAKKELVFRKFMYTHLNPEKGFVKEIPDDKDLYIIGSDQLWRKFGDRWFDDVYMGYFPTKPGAKKITYAVSGEGMQFDDDNIAYLKDAFKNFSMISMREGSIARQYARYADGKDIEVVLDPTLLADRSIYDEIGEKDPLPDKDYVFVYAIRFLSTSFIEKILEYARSKGWELVMMSEGIDYSLINLTSKHSDIHYFKSSGEEEWLGAMKKAKCVFTPSFHGAAFSLIFHKTFYSLQLNDGHDTRARNLLEGLGIADRLLDIDGEITDKQIDYTEPDKRLQKFKEASLDFLKRALD